MKKYGYPSSDLSSKTVEKLENSDMSNHIRADNLKYP